MALDFPASPTVGQQFTAAGVTWTWDGTKWTASGLSGGPFLPLAGGTLTGDLTINESSITRLWLNSPTNGFGNFVYGQKGGLNRWFAAFGDGTAESGGNAGSNFYLGCAADNGTGLWTPISINRASGQVTIPNLNAPQAIGDNRIINGDMRIDQRNNGSSSTAAGYTVDRWLYNLTQSGKFTWGRSGGGNGVSGPAGLPYCLGFVSMSAFSAAAGDVFEVYQPIEADFVGDLAWGTASAQPVTLSFWAYSSKTGTFGGSIRNTTRSYPFTYAIASASTWTKITLTIPGDTAGAWTLYGNAAAFLVSFDLGCGSTYRGPANAWAAAQYCGATGAVSIVATNGATFYLTGVKLEIGSVATPFNRQSLAKSLADCQRYYSIKTALSMILYNSAASVAFGYSVALPVTMRAAPTIAFVNPSYSNASGITAANVQLDGLFVYATGTAISGSQWSTSLTASAEL